LLSDVEKAMYVTKPGFEVLTVDEAPMKARTEDLHASRNNPNIPEGAFECVGHLGIDERHGPQALADLAWLGVLQTFMTWT
jgi:hypothetical protein